MIVAPIYTRNLNGMLVGAYSQQAIAKMTAPEPVAPRAIQTYMSFDITPERGDMAEIRRYFAAQEAARRWGYQATIAPKQKTTDELVREFLIKSTDKANERRAMKDAETDMPYYSVLATDGAVRQMTADALTGTTAPTEAAPVSIEATKDFGSDKGRRGAKSKDAFRQERMVEKAAKRATAAGRKNKDAKIAKSRAIFLQPPVVGAKRDAEYPRGGSPPATKRAKKDEE